MSEGMLTVVSVMYLEDPRLEDPSEIFHQSAGTEPRRTKSCESWGIALVLTPKTK